MNDNIKKFYDDDAQKYDERWQTFGGRRNFKIQRAIVNELMFNWSDKRILEIGAGTGRFSTQIIEHTESVFIADLSSEMLRFTEDRISEFTDKYYLAESSVYSLPYKNCVFDAIFSVNMLNHIKDIDCAICELSRVLKTGGHYLISFTNLHSYYFPMGLFINNQGKAYRKDVYSVWRSYKVFLRKLEKAGLMVDQIRGNVHIPLSLDFPFLRNIILILDNVSRRGLFSRFSPTIFVVGTKV